MGMDADLICVIGFRNDLDDCLDYPGEYGNVPEGYPIVVTFFPCESSSHSHELARAIGADPSNFGTHFVQMDNVDLNSLHELAEVASAWDEEDVDKFVRVMEKGGLCFFRPNR